ncbi:hypothetical protein AXG93_4874s1270 [Marchantia polymorpha subsp. ruderalis]|uniref:Uncharacterized protein n=1 Tax=Marchantia polymorpha subsp. ruderalis TaxID=1480154 RepID=A0A176WHF2_MARPO|nr:hypothetical protein AXG93_4874s1270 [Marchantia polymorpha subsp. ruderalis]
MFEENKCTIHVVFGDFKDDLKEVVMHLKNALPYADTDEQREIVTCFIDYLETGSIESHKRSQVLWLNQKEPSIDVNIGFVETYRDPHGSRAEFEGYVATINKAASKQFLALTERADKLLALLPWPKEFHGEKFQCPDFTCFEIVVYANGTIPTGINLPNYEDVREAHGSKNICLSNVLNSEDYRTQTSFLLDEDVQILKRTKGEVFLIHLACHELLGHGSGKLFTKSKEGEYNFPHGKIRHPFTGEPVINCYGPGDTWNSVFENISSAFEECRAECVGLFFSTLPEALETFGHTGQYAEDLMYLNWLIMVRAGFLAIEFYSEDKGHWRQAHMQLLLNHPDFQMSHSRLFVTRPGYQFNSSLFQARFAILRTLLSASERDAEEVLAKGTRESAQGSEFLKIEHRRNRSAVIRLNRKKIRSVGLPAIRELLMKLQVYRSTADAEKGREFFTELTTIPRNLMEWRRIVLANKRARPICVQVHTRLIEDNDGESHVIMEEFPATPLGIIESHVARFKNWAFEC